MPVVAYHHSNVPQDLRHLPMGSCMAKPWFEMCDWLLRSQAEYLAEATELQFELQGAAVVVHPWAHLDTLA